MVFNLLHPKSVRCRKEQKNNMVILHQYANAVIFLCSRVSGQPSHATAPALMSLEATRTIVRGRQPRSGLMCILCKLMFLCSRGKRQAQTLYLMSLCPSVLLFSALAANQSTLRRQPLCFLRPPGRKSVAVRRAAALCVSYANLCSYVPAVSG